MTALDRTSKAPGMTLSYVTIGAVMTVLGVTSFFFFPLNAAHPILGYMRVCATLIGVILLFIGFGVGPLSRAARTSEAGLNEAALGPAVHPQSSPAAPGVAPANNLGPIVSSTTTGGNAH